MGNVLNLVRTEDFMNGGITPIWMWISWSQSVLTIGTGNVVGKDLILMHPDASNLRAASTVEVSSFQPTDTAKWMIPYDQGKDVFTGLDIPYSKQFLDFDTTVCKDVIFPGYPDVTTVAYIQPVLQGRTSLVFKTDSYSSFIKVFMTTDNQTDYSITGLPFLTYIYKFSTKRAASSAKTLPSYSGPEGMYWLSWSAGIIAVGRGDVIGQNTLSVADEHTNITFTNITMMFNGSLTVPFGYFFGFSALTRNDVSSRVRSLQLEKVASDACVSYCATEAVENPDCSLSFCSNACVSNTNCTAFCIRQPASIGQPCSCELQSIPGNPLSDGLLRAETGASYWMVYT